jgi:hypothetical protein
VFEDLEEENVDVHPDSPDRAIAWAIASRGDTGTVTPVEGWAILHERYPDDPRFLLLSVYAEINEAKQQVVGAKVGTKPAADVLTSSYVLGKLNRLFAADPSGALEPQLRELTVFGSALLTSTNNDEAKSVKATRDRLGIEGESKRDDRDRAGLKLRRFEREVLKELHDRTDGGKPLGTARQVAAKKPANDWASATSDASKPRRKYAPDQRFEAGELVEHPKFGVGLITGTEPGKAVILFESGVRKLIAG